MRGQIHDIEGRVCQNARNVVGRVRVGKEFVPARYGLFKRSAGNCGDIPTGGSIGVEMGARDSAGPDERDFRRIGFRRRRKVVQLRCRYLRKFGGLQRVFVVRRGLFGHGSSSIVRLDSADRNAVSTIR